MTMRKTDTKQTSPDVTGQLLHCFISVIWIKFLSLQTLILTMFLFFLFQKCYVLKCINVKMMLGHVLARSSAQENIELKTRKQII